MHRQFRITSCRAMAPAPLGGLLSPNTSRRRARKVVPKVTQISCNSASAGVLHPQYGHVPHWLSAQLIDPPWNLHLCLLGPCFMAQASQASAMLLLQDRLLVWCTDRVINRGCFDDFRLQQGFLDLLLRG
jgi:hypothetical protein